MEWKLPDLGEGIQEGEIVKWLVDEGDSVSIDQPLVEIMTDKATMELPSSFDGRVQEILVKEGDIAKVGQALAVIGEGTVPKAKKGKPVATKAASVVPTTTAPVVAPKPRADAPVARARPAGAKPLAAPSVRRIAREKGIELATIQGTGPGGRILRQDLNGGRKVPAAVVAAATSETTTAPVWISHGPEERQPIRGLRRKIAEHMILSRKTAAHFTHIDEADLTELVALREKEKGMAKNHQSRRTIWKRFP